MTVAVRLAYDTGRSAHVIGVQSFKRDIDYAYMVC
jgi:hypothetical protein